MAAPGCWLVICVLIYLLLTRPASATSLPRGGTPSVSVNWGWGGEQADGRCTEPFIVYLIHTQGPALILPVRTKLPSRVSGTALDSGPKSVPSALPALSKSHLSASCQEFSPGSGFAPCPESFSVTSLGVPYAGGDTQGFVCTSWVLP